MFRTITQVTSATMMPIANPSRVNAMHDLRTVDRTGIGIQRVVADCRQHGRPERQITHSPTRTKTISARLISERFSSSTAATDIASKSRDRFGCRRQSATSTGNHAS